MTPYYDEDEGGELSEPTARDYCARDGHPYYGDDGELGRCYCGDHHYPKGTP